MAAITRDDTGDRHVFSWSYADPPLHARYRLEWDFRGRTTQGQPPAAPSEVMSSLGVVQHSEEILRRVAAIVRTPDGEAITLFNPSIIDTSGDTDEQYEGCLSFFDVRGHVLRAHIIHVEHTTIDGTKKITFFARGTARLIAHEVDHLHATSTPTACVRGSPLSPSSNIAAPAPPGNTDLRGEMR